MKVLFLDIDGVFVLRGEEFLSEAMNNLRTLCLQCTPYIVIMSSWRKSQTKMDHLKLVFESYSLQIYSITEGTLTKKKHPQRKLGFRKIRVSKIFTFIFFSGDDTCRVGEVDDWLRAHAEKNIEAWVCVDDMDLSMHFGHVVDGHFVHVDAEIGFSEANVKLALELFQKQQP